MSEHVPPPAASLVDIQVVNWAGSNERGFPLLLRSVIRTFFHLLTFGLIPESPRTAVRVSLRGTGTVIHETGWEFDAEGAASLAEQMQADADRMALAEFCAEWNIAPPGEGGR